MWKNWKAPHKILTQPDEIRLLTQTEKKECSKIYSLGSKLQLKPVHVL